jgi:hypothetical protein
MGKTQCCLHPVTIKEGNQGIHTVSWLLEPEAIIKIPGSSQPTAAKSGIRKSSPQIP